jgi:hypothetical protein
MRPRGTSSSGDRDGNTYVTAEVLRKAVGRPQPYRRHSLHDWEAQMIQMKIRWGDLGAPTKPGTYPCGPHMVEITPGDIKLAEGNPDAVFIAIPHQSVCIVARELFFRSGGWRIGAAEPSDHSRAD